MSFFSVKSIITNGFGLYSNPSGTTSGTITYQWSTNGGGVNSKVSYSTGYTSNQTLGVGTEWVGTTWTCQARAVSGSNTSYSTPSSVTLPAYSFSYGPSSVEEGQTSTNFLVSSTNGLGPIYWQVTTSSGGDFSTSTGQVGSASSSAGVFTVTPTSDGITEGTETATVKIYINNTFNNLNYVYASDTFNITDAVVATAPTVSYITTGTEAAQYISCTVNLSGIGSNGTLQYACAQGDSTPDNWQLSSHFPSIAARGGSTIYGRARSVGPNNTATSNTVSVASPGYLLPDTSVNLEPETQTLAFNADEASLSFSGGTAGERTQIFRTDDNSDFGSSFTLSNLTKDSGNIPANGQTVTYQTKHRRPISTGGDGVTYYNGNDTVTITRQGVTAPTINSITNNNAAAANVTATVNASGGTGGTITYNQTTTATLPSTGWTLSNTFSHPRGTTRYYWASRNQGTSGYVSTAHAIGYIAPDTTTSISPTSLTISNAASSGTFTVSGLTVGEDVRLFNVGESDTSGQVNGVSSSSVSIVVSSDLPAAGSSPNTLRVDTRRPTNIGGSGSFVSTGTTATITREGTPNAPTDLTFTTSDPQEQTMDVTVTASGGGGSGNYHISRSTQSGFNAMGADDAFTFNNVLRAITYTYTAKIITASGSESNNYFESFTVPGQPAVTNITITNVDGQTGTSANLLDTDEDHTVTFSGATANKDIYYISDSASTLNILGTSSDNSTTTRTISSNDVPAAGASKNYYLWVIRPTNQFGDKLMGVMSFSEAAERYERKLSDKGRKPDANKRSILKRLKERIGDLPLDEIDRMYIDDLHAWLATKEIAAFILVETKESK